MFGKVNVKGGLTGGWPHFVKPTTFANGGFTPSRQGQAASRSPMANLDPFALSKAGVEPDIPHNSIDHSLRGKPQNAWGASASSLFSSMSIISVISRRADFSVSAASLIVFTCKHRHDSSLDVTVFVDQCFC